MNAAPHLRYSAGLSGLRGVLALLVLLFHTGVPIIPGGARGVDMFFVLSGFLITELLKIEIERNGSIDYLAFWRRRLQRLMPALFLFTLVYVATAPTAFPGDVAAFRIRDAIATLTYSYNWDLVIRPRLTGMGHMWSLAVEGQFYLLWPLVIGHVHRLGRRAAPVLLAVFLGLTAFRAVGVCLVRDSGPIIYSLPGHASGLVLGALLAYLPRQPRWLGYLGLAGMAAFITLPDRHDMVWGQLWTISVAELSAAALICGLITPAPTSLTRVFSGKLLVALGAISYEIYIWHFPFQRFSAGRSWIVESCFTLTGALTLAWLSHRLVGAGAKPTPSAGDAGVYGGLEPIARPT